MERITKIVETGEKEGGTQEGRGAEERGYSSIMIGKQKSEGIVP